ncbi:Glycosyltransferase involved in cell wall bisynthesis [Butyrivibrio sp. Su6]|uniref:glycosyltransferase family 2 protein n=1 Tax=Butyrivibrio sp. Su6 TaxID=1520810 RepID=UPI00089E217E|nr:glycosyltransferase family A protein [Butyrivibrio sp. Su6]SEF66513.1 Glycosyltransferase involved in cell wall bisynthesis [Butyrivibrio sp. Su6]
MRISVIIPTYNRADKIEKSIESVFSQEGDGELFEITELLVMDDCSTDNTKDVIVKLKEKYPKLSYYKMEVNGGAAKARNYAIKNLIKTEWAALQDSDDIWDLDKLKEMSTYIEKKPDAWLYSHWYTALTKENGEVQVGIDEREDYLEELALRNFIGSPTILVNKKAFCDVGGFDENIKALEDWEFLIRFAYRYKIRVIPKSLMKVDLISEGMSSDIGKYYDARCYIIAKNKDILLERKIFDKAVESLLLSAKKNGVLENVGNILSTYLK